MVLQIENKEHFQNQLSEAGDKLVVVDFFATWCGPCKVIAPKLEELSKEFTDVVFLKVDIDDCEDLTTEYGIDTIPTFYFIKGNSNLEHFAGTNYEKIRETIIKYK